MTDFSPEMRKSLDALRREQARQAPAGPSAADVRRRNMNAVDRLTRDARALGEIARRRGFEPYTTVNTETYRPKTFFRSEQRHRQPVLKGWALTWKHIIGKPQAPYKDPIYYDGLNPSHYVMSTLGQTLGFVTMIGVDCNLYVLETQGLHSTGGSSNTVALTGSYSDRSTRQLILASSQSSHLGNNNPQVLAHTASQHVADNMDADLMSHAMLSIAANKELY